MPQTRASRELPYQDYLADSHRPAFDGLRGIGFLFVITAHVPSVPLFRLLQGWTAVWVFLAMSGYLVTMLLLREEKRDGRFAFGSFLVKRFFRIVPAYVAAILVYGLACLAFAPFADDYAPFIARLPYYLAFVPEYADTDGFSIFTHSWTVGVELKFYLLFPPVAFLMLRNANARFAATAIAAALLTAEGSFLSQAYCAILCGAMLAFALERPRGYAVVAALTRVPVAVPLALVAALLVLLHYTTQFTAIAAVATYLIAYATVQPAAVAPLLNWRPLAYLGQRSYGAYLLHFLALRIGYLVVGGDGVTAGVVAALVCVVLTVPAAELLYRVVEQPGLACGRHLLRRLAPAAVR